MVPAIRLLLMIVVVVLVHFGLLVFLLSTSFRFDRCEREKSQTRDSGCEELFHTQKYDASNPHIFKIP